MVERNTTRNWMRGIAALALFMLPPADHWSQVKTPNPSNAQKQNPKKQRGNNVHPDPTRAPAMPTVVPSPTPPREASTEDGSSLKSKEEEYNPGTDELYRLYLRATIAGVAVAVFGFGTLIYQTILGKRGTKAAKESADAAGKSADAALKSATAVINSERAWIVADPETAPPFVKDHIVRIIVRLKNVGKTPARIIEVAERAFVGSEACPLPENPEYLPNNIHRSPLKGGALMAPNATMPPLVYVTPGDMERVERGEWILHVFGYVVYRDLFSEQEHRTDYGFYLNIPMGGSDPATRMFFISDLPGYNEAI